MRLLFGFALRRYLAHQVLGKEIGRKPPQRASALYHGPIRDEAYLQWVRAQPSIVSGQTPCEAAHTGTDGGTSEKASDDSCVPLTPAEHREYHQRGKRDFERKYRLNFADECTRLQARWRELWSGNYRKYGTNRY